MSKYNQGIFKPKNPKKYAGDPKKIVFRSSWEWSIMDRFDRSPDIVEWASEEFFIRYYDPVSDKMRRYFPDFIVKVKKDKKIIKQIVEVKPITQCFEPVAKKNKKSYIMESAEYAKNMAKWKATKEFCKKHDMEFIIITKHPKSGEFLVLTEEQVGL